MRSRPKGPLTDGARKLLAYLEEKKLSIPTFCEQHELPRVAVQRALNGDRQRFAVDFAWGIETATAGEVICSDWRAATLRGADAASASSPRPPITGKKRRPTSRLPTVKAITPKRSRKAA